MATVTKVPYLIVVVVMLLGITYPVEGLGAQVCEGDYATVDCLMKNSKELYDTDIDLFWKILNMAAKKAEDCKTIKDATLFMKIVNVPRDGAFEEYFRKKIEHLFINKDKCFLDALATMTRSEQTNMLGLLLNPLFVDQAIITDIFQKNRGIAKYKIIVEMYFERIE